MSVQEPIRILLVGNGGREHALAWKLSQSNLVESIIVVPGNGGTASSPKVTNNTSVKADDYPGRIFISFTVPLASADVSCENRACRARTTK